LEIVFHTGLTFLSPEQGEGEQEEAGEKEEHFANNVSTDDNKADKAVTFKTELLFIEFFFLRKRSFIFILSLTFFLRLA